MSRIFITGSSDGLGLMAAQLLVKQGHSVVLHARNAERAEVTRRRLPGAEAVVTGDLASLQQMRLVADEVNALGSFDAITFITQQSATANRTASRRRMGLHTCSPAPVSVS